MRQIWLYIACMGFDEQHWMKVASGSQVINQTPEQLWQNAVDYFRWSDDNPIKAKRTLQSGKEAGQKVGVEFNRPYSIKALCLHIGVSEKWIRDISETHAKDSPWYITMERILMVIYTQNLEGAVVDLYNPVIISKILNLDTKQEVENQTVRVEIVNTGITSLPNSENEILEKLDFGKAELVMQKAEFSKEQSTHTNE